MSCSDQVTLRLGVDDDNPLTLGVTTRQLVLGVPIPVDVVSAQGVKSGVLIPGDFSGTPKEAAVSFSSAFSSADYGITLGAGTINDRQFVPVYESKTASGFTVNLGTDDTQDLVQVEWHAIQNGS